MQTLNKIQTTTKSGQAVEFRICEHLNEICVGVWAGGKSVATGTPEAVGQTVQGNYVYGKIGRVHLSNAQTWTDVLAAYTEAKTQLEATDEYKGKQLRDERKRLVYAVKDAQDELYHHENQLVEKAMRGEPHHYDSAALERQIAAAKAAQDVFDAAHPEVLATLTQERDAALERNRWN